MGMGEAFDAGKVMQIISHTGLVLVRQGLRLRHESGLLRGLHAVNLRNPYKLNRYRADSAQCVADLPQPKSCGMRLV